MAIKYEAYNWSGEKVTGVLEADTEEGAYAQLERENLVPYKLRPVRVRRTLVQIAPTLFQPKPQDVIDFTTQLTSLLQSGIPIRRSLMVQYEQVSNKGLKEALRQIIEEVEGGNRISEAFARHGSVFPDWYVRLLRVGEATGGIAVMLKQLGSIMQRRKAVRDRVKGALTVPAITIVIAFIAGFVLLTYSLPAVVGMLEEFGGELPTVTKLVISMVDLAQAYGLLVFGSVVGGAVAAFLWMRTATGARIRDHVVLRLPMVGGILTKSNMFAMTTNLVTMMDAGIPVIESLRMAERSMGNVALRDSMAEVAREASEGTRLGQAFSKQELVPTLVSQAVSIGEMRGSMVDTLRGLSEYYEQQTERAVSGLTELIQPALTLVIAVFVGFIAVATIAGIYSTMTAIE